MESTNPSNKRLYWIDWLRVLIVVTLPQSILRTAGRPERTKVSGYQ